MGAWQDYNCESIRTFRSGGVLIMEYQCFCPTNRNIYRITQITAPWTDESLNARIEKMMSAACPPPVTPPAEVCPRGSMYSPLPFQSCDPGYTRKFDWRVLGYNCFCTETGAVPPAPPVTPPVIPPEKCSRGAIYTRGMFQECDPGYYQGDIPGAGIPGMGMACICAEGYIPPHIEEENGILPGKLFEIPDLSGISQIFNLLPFMVIAAIIIAALGLFKR